MSVHLDEGEPLSGAVQVPELALIEGQQDLGASAEVAQVVGLHVGRQVLGVAVVVQGGGALLGLEVDPAHGAQVVLGVKLEIHAEAGRVEALLKVQVAVLIQYVVVADHHGLFSFHCQVEGLYSPST